MMSFELLEIALLEASIHSKLFGYYDQNFPFIMEASKLGFLSQQRVLFDRKDLPI